MESIDNKKLLIIGGIVVLGVLLLSFKSKGKARPKRPQIPQRPQKTAAYGITFLGPLPKEINTKQALLDHFYVAFMKVPDMPQNEKYEKWKSWENKIKDLSFDEIKLSYACLNGIYSKDDSGNRLNLNHDPLLFRECMNWQERTKIPLE